MKLLEGLQNFTTISAECETVHYADWIHWALLLCMHLHAVNHMGGYFQGLIVVLDAKMILWAYLFMVQFNYLNLMYIKLSNFPTIRQPQEIHENFNTTKNNNHNMWQGLQKSTVWAKNCLFCSFVLHHNFITIYNTKAKS